MRRYIYVLLAAAAVVLSGCKKNEPAETQTSGLRLTLKSEASYTDKVLKSGTQADYDLSDYLVTISKKDGKYSETWVYSEMPSLVELSVGDYTINVTSPVESIAAWDMPLFGVSKDFPIVAGAVTPLELVCTLQNMKNSVYCSEYFLSKLTDFNVKIVVKSDDEEVEGQYLVWSRDEVGVYSEAADGTKTIVKEPTKRAYFPVNELEVYVDGYVQIDNTTANLTYKITDVAARDHHIIYLNAHVTSQSQISLKIDESVTNKPFDVIYPGVNPDDENIDDDIEVGWGEPEEDADIELPSTEPTLEWPANPEFAVLDIVEGMSVELVVKAPKKIKTFIVRVSDNFLGAIRLAVGDDTIECLDLIDHPKTVTAMTGLLPVGDQLYGKDVVDFSLSSLVPLIAAPGVGIPGDDYVFTMVVTDMEGQTLEKSVTFHNPSEEESQTE